MPLSFAAKFCRLNHLTSFQFRIFFVEAVENIRNFYYFQLYRDDGDELILKQIACILDEPLSTVRTAFWPNRLGWGDLSLYKNILDKHEIGYCPQCLTEGYHGYFHECPWLKKCPIHYIDIEIKSVGMGTKFDQCVHELSLLFDQYCPEWYITDGKYLSEHAVHTHPLFHAFVNWHFSVQKAAQEWSDANIYQLDYYTYKYSPDKFYHLEHFNLLLSRLSWITPIPNKINGLFGNGLQYVEPNVQLFDQKFTDEFIAITSQINFETLLFLYKFSNYVSGQQSLSHQKVVEAAIDALKARHKSEKCFWAIHNNEGRWSYFKEGFHSDCWWGYHCPYELAINELNQEWLALTPNKFSKILSAYHLTVNDCSDNTNIFTVNKKLYRPIIKFIWSAEMCIFVETIFEKIATFHIDELNQWLLSIEQNKLPDTRMYLPPSAFLWYKKNSNLQLITWPTIREKS